MVKICQAAGEVFFTPTNLGTATCPEEPRLRVAFFFGFHFGAGAKKKLTKESCPGFGIADELSARSGLRFARLDQGDFVRCGDDGLTWFDRSFVNSFKPCLFWFNPLALLSIRSP